MKKIMIYILLILLLTIITAGATYAYLAASTNSVINVITGESAQLVVNYTGGKKIEGSMSLSKDKTGGHNTTVNISIAENSVIAKADLFININSISSSLATEGLIWEVYKTINGTESFVGSGTFATCYSGTKCSNGDKMLIVNDYVLSTTNTAFTVYVWLNGDKVGNEVIGATFSGTISAETEEYTGELG